MLFVLSKEIRAAKGDKREERERVTHVVWGMGGGKLFSAAESIKILYKQISLTKQITAGQIKIFRISRETIL